MRKTCRLKLVLDVEYDMGETSVDWLRSQLHKVVRNATGEGLLTGNSDATVEGWDADVFIIEEPQHDN